MSDDPLSRAHQEIERLQYEVEVLKKQVNSLFDDEIRLKNERDEARRNYCYTLEVLQEATKDPKRLSRYEHATHYGWDCYGKVMRNSKNREFTDGMADLFGWDVMSNMAKENKNNDRS